MGRRPIIRESILKILKSADNPLSFGEIRQAVAIDLNREIEKVAQTNIDKNLKFLIKNG